MVEREDRQREELEEKDQQKHATSVARKGTCQKIARPTLSYANAQIAENKDIWHGSAGRQQSGRWATMKKKTKKGHNIWVGGYLPGRRRSIRGTRIACIGRVGRAT